MLLPFFTKEQQEWFAHEALFKIATRAIERIFNRASLLLSFPMSGKWGDFVDYRKFVLSINYFMFKKNKKIMFKFVREACILWSKANKDKSTEIFPPLLLNHLIYAQLRMCNADSPKVQQKVQILKKTIVLCPSRSY